jgi:hypothetical protein
LLNILTRLVIQFVRKSNGGVEDGREHPAGGMALRAEESILPKFAFQEI